MKGSAVQESKGVVSRMGRVPKVGLGRVLRLALKVGDGARHQDLGKRIYGMLHMSWFLLGHILHFA